jgi:hypothetical protein
MPLDSTKLTKNSEREDLCLVKVYEDSTYTNVVSYWLPKNTTKSLASAVFRYYRQKFTERSTAPVNDPFIFWTRLKFVGDNHLRGNAINRHWDPISRYFNRKDSTGKLAIEPCIDRLTEDGEDSGEESEDKMVGGSHPYVLKLCLGAPPTATATRNNTLSRLDVLKQMFDAYINRLLAYNFQTHVGLITFSTRASVVSHLVPPERNNADI